MVDVEAEFFLDFGGVLTPDEEAEAGEELGDHFMSPARCA
jgi:hypothetical protein